MKIREDVYNEFWYFASERQKIWYKKMILTPGAACDNLTLNL